MSQGEKKLWPKTVVTVEPGTGSTVQVREGSIVIYMVNTR